MRSYRTWALLLFLIALSFSWAPFYLALAEAIRLGSSPSAYPYEWTERQPALICVIWFLGIFVRPILFILSIYTLMMTRKDWHWREFVLPVATLLITSIATLFDFWAGVVDRAIS
jgi:hypothetical protein